MLKNIFLILTSEYKEKLVCLPSFAGFTEDMRSRGTEVIVADTEEAGARIGNMEMAVWEDSLFLSDDENVLNDIQLRGGYTVAVYHSGVKGILPGTQFAIEEVEEAQWDYLCNVYHRFWGKPLEITQTKRCIIREMCEGDVDALYELYNSPEVVRYTEPLFSEREKEIQYIKDYIEHIYKYYGMGIWLIIRKEDGKIIGRAGFEYRPGFEEPELGFLIGEPYWRKGYAYEVCSHLLELGRTEFGFEKVQAFAMEENKASVQLLGKLGFEYMEPAEINGQNYERFVSKLAI